MKDLFYGTKGHPDAPIVFVGESWGEDEKRKQQPFVGSSGVELDRILARAGVPHDQILFTNVVADQPRGNEMWRFFEPKASFTGRKIGGLAPTSLVCEEASKVYTQILSHPRKLVIAAGNYALWALSRVTGAKVQSQSNNRLIPKDQQTWSPNGIMSWRGSMWYCEPHEEFFPSSMTLSDWPKVQLLPIVHPAAIMRAWYMRDPTIHDLKTRVPLALASDWRDEHRFLAPPSFEECMSYLQGWVDVANRGIQIRLAVDIENLRRSKLMTCVGFAASPRFAISIPFIRRTENKGFESWWSVEEEAEIIRQIRRILSHPLIEIDGQNFIYDTQYFQSYMGVTPHLSHDTMLHHNTMFPGTPKDLGYLSSLYCKYHWYWKEDAKEWDEKGSIEDLLNYNCLDSVRTWEIGQNQREVTRSLGMEEQFKFKMETNHLCLRMMNRGVSWDTQRAGSTRVEMQEALTQLHLELLEIIPQEWLGPVGKRSSDKGGGPIYWITSDVQQKRLFYDFLGFRVVREPKTGQLTSGKKALGQFKLWYPEFMGLLERLDMAGSIENTVNVLRSKIDSDGRIRCSYNPGGAETHRLSSSENAFGGGTNLQNLTKGEEDE